MITIHVIIYIRTNRPVLLILITDFLYFNMGSSQSAPIRQVVNTIEPFGYHPATVFKFFVVIGIIAGVTIFALAIWRHKKALSV